MQLMLKLDTMNLVFQTNGLSGTQDLTYFKVKVSVRVRVERYCELIHVWLENNQVPEDIECIL